MARAPIPQTMFDYISERGPLPLAELGAHAAALALTKARDPGETVKSRLGEDRRFVELPDGRWTTLPLLLDGRWFTHKVRDDEVVAQAFADELDLGVPYRAVGPGLDLVHGGHARTWRGYLSGDDSWLEGVSGGDVVGVTFRHRRLAVTRLTESPPMSLAARKVANVVRAALPPESPYGDMPVHAATRALLAALAADDELLRTPVPPLSELLPEVAAQPTSDWWLTEGRGCDISIEEGCGCYRCTCRSVGRVWMELEGTEMRNAARRFAAAGLSLTERIAEAVQAVLSEEVTAAAASDRTSLRSMRRTGSYDW